MYRCAEKSLGRRGLVENGVRLLSAAGSGGRRTWGRGTGEYRPEDGRTLCVGLGQEDWEDKCGSSWEEGECSSVGVCGGRTLVNSVFPGGLVRCVFSEDRSTEDINRLRTLSR